MPSPVDICNLALSYLGDTATVSSIEPPDGSMQAQHCARFYPIAKATLLEAASWNFATKRVALARVTNPSAQWLFAYAMPAGVSTLIAVIDPNSTGDYSQFITNPAFWQNSRGLDLLGTSYAPQPYTIDIDSSGKQIIYTNVENAMLRYTIIVEDTTQFSAMFVTALAYLLASMLAGPLIKGETGATESLRCLSLYEKHRKDAAGSDANQVASTVQQATPWITGR